MVPVTHSDLKNTLNARISEVLGPLLGSIPILHDNEKEDITAELWVRATILTGGNKQADMAGEDTRFRRMGIIVFSIFGELGIGTKAIDEIVGHIETVFRRKRIDGVVYRTPDPQNLGRQGKHWQTNVTCPFWVDVF